VQNARDLDRLYAIIREEWGKIDILVANAGFIDPQALVDTTEQNFDKTFDINVRGLLFTVQKALPLIRDGGSIILLSSVATFKGIPNSTAHSVTKACGSFLRPHMDRRTQRPRYPRQCHQPWRDRHAHYRRAGEHNGRCGCDTGKS